jgi:hypothetical protein
MPGASACLAMPSEARLLTVLSVQVVADVLEDLAHDRAQEEQGHDHDDRNKGQEQSVLNESLAFLVLAAVLGEKRTVELKHMCALPPFLKD